MSTIQTLMPAGPGRSRGKAARPGATGSAQADLGEFSGLGDATALGDMVTAHLELPATLQSVGAARRFTEFVLGSWSIGVSADDTKLIVSELVANAVFAVSTARLGGGLTIILALAVVPGLGLHIEVWDPVAAERDLEAIPPDPDLERGRGLFLVGELAASWGQSHAPTGTRVWARLAPLCAAHS